MKKITTSLFVALMFAGSSMAAHAAPVNLSGGATIVTQDLTDYSSTVLGKTYTLDAGVQAGIGGNFFNDIYKFTTTGTNDITGLITSLTTSSNSGLTVTGFELRDDHGIVFHGTQDLTNYSANEQAWGFTSNLHPLAAGNYFVEVSGYVSSLNGGSYSGNLSISAVPEPETYAMLLAGFGVIGFAVRRRKVLAA